MILGLAFGLSILSNVNNNQTCSETKANAGIKKVCISFYPNGVRKDSISSLVKPHKGWPESISVFDGISKYWYQNGSLKSKWEFRDGCQIDSLYQVFYSNSQPSMNEHYSACVKDGLSQRFDSTGGLLFEGAYKNGKKIGWQREYWRKGVPKHEMFYDSSTFKASEEKSWYSNGRMMTEINIENGFEETKDYAPNGTLVQHTRAKAADQNLIEGESFDPDGKPTGKVTQGKGSLITLGFNDSTMVLYTKYGYDYKDGWPGKMKQIFPKPPK